MGSAVWSIRGLPSMARRGIPAKAWKEAETSAAIEEAAGPENPLPVLVDRAGRIESVSPLEAFVSIRKTAMALTVDVEHSGYPIGHQHYHLRTVQLGNEEVAAVFDPDDPEQAAYIRALLAVAAKLHAHSAAADLAPLEHAGLCRFDAWEKMYDTVIPAKIAATQYNGKEGGLKELAKQLVPSAVSPAAEQARKTYYRAAKWLENVDVDDEPERSGWAQCDYTRATMQVYAASDVLDTAALALVLPPVRQDVLERERAAERITAKLTHVGVPLNRPQVEKMHAHHTELKRQHLEVIQQEYGVENPGSPKQLGERLIELGADLPKTDKGNPSTAGPVMNTLRHESDSTVVSDLAEQVIKWRHSNTALSLLLEPFRQRVLYGDGRVRPTVYTLNADTGRMSMSRENLQQVSREGGIRACIMADPGYLLIAADLSNVEVRVAAGLSGDKNLLRMIDAGIDLHSVIAEQVWGKDFTKGHRYVAKRAVFGRLYGGGFETLAAQVGVSIPVIKEVCQTLDDTAPELAEWSQNLRAEVRAGVTRMETYSGRIIHLPPDFPHKAPNYAIQGSARELLIDGLLRWDQTRWGGGVVLPIHDEILATVPADEADEAVATLAECMRGTFKGVPIDAEPDKPMEVWQDAS